MLSKFVVTLKDDPEDKFTWVFECMAEDTDHAEEQAENAYPEIMEDSRWACPKCVRWDRRRWCLATCARWGFVSVTTWPKASEVPT